MADTSTASNVNNMPYVPPVGSTPGGGAANLPGNKAGVVATKTQSNTGAGIPAVSSSLADTSVTVEQLRTRQDPTTKLYDTVYIDANGAERPAILYATTDGTPAIATDIDAYRNAVVQQGIKQYGSLQEFKKFLARKGAYSNIVSRATTASINDAGEDATFLKVLDNNINDLSRTSLLTGNVQDLISYVNGRPNYAGTRTTTTTSFTSLSSAANDMDLFMMQNLGRHATLVEIQDYYKMLHSYESDPKNATKATVTTDGMGMERNRVQTQGPSAEDLKMILVASATPSIEAAGKDPAAISQVGGTVGTYMKQLTQRVGQQGLSTIITPDKVFQAAVAATQPGSKIEDQLTKVDQLAMAQPKYKALAPSLALGYTVQDLAKPYTDNINKYLETNTPANPNDPLVLQGLTGGANGGSMNDTEFIKLIKSQPDWAKTNNAKEEAASYINQLGKLMGFTA